MRMINLDGRLHVSIRHGLVDIATESHGYFSSEPQKIYEQWAESLSWYTSNRDRLAPTHYDGIDPGRLGSGARTASSVRRRVELRRHAAESGVEPPIRR